MGKKNPFRLYENFNCQHDFSYMYFFYKILNLFITRFKWINLPEYIPPYFLEYTLFYRANALFVKDNNIDMYGVFKTNLTGMPDIYNIPDMREAYAVTGYISDYYKDNSVIIWDNPTRFPFFYNADFYCRRLSNAVKTQDLNMYVQRTPFIVKSPTAVQRLTYSNIAKDYDMFVPFVKIDDSVDIKNLDALKLDAPYLVDSIESFIGRLWSQVLTDLGYESNPINKKERLISQEVEGNNGETEGQRNVGLTMRKRACDAINKLWGLNIDVEFNTKLPTPLNGYGPYEDVKEGDNNEPVHNKNT